MTTPFQCTQTFTPTQISGCQLWFDAADTTTFSYGSGTLISQWRDKSSNAYNVIQPTSGNQPTLTQVSQNGLPGIQFAINTFLYQTATSMPNFTTGPATSVLMAARNASVNSGWNIINTIWFTTGGAGATSRYHFSFNQNTTAGTTLYANVSLVGQVTSNATPPSANTIFGFTVSPTSATIHTNSSTNSYPGTTLPDATGSTAFIFNDPRNTSAASDNIMIFEMVGYNKQISTAQRQQLEGYLAWKWGMVSNLPADHPYKTTPILSLPAFSNAPRVKNLTSTPFNPLSVPSCQLWLDGADKTQFTYSSGTTIATWKDKSGLGNTATATGTITMTAAINSIPTPNWSGSFSTYFSGAVANSSNVLTAFSVYTMNSSSYGVARVLSLAKPGFNDWNNNLYTAAIERNASSFNAFRNNANLGTVTATFGSPVFVCSQFNGTNHTFYMNGTAGTSVGSTGNFGYTNYEIGTSFGEESLVNFNGTIAEVLIYNASLSTSDRQTIEGYLAWKWGLVGSLPVTHPYKTTPPYGLQPFPLVTLVPSMINKYFNPTTITGCALWLDAADPSTIATSGGIVSTVLDKSGTNKAITVTNTVTYIPKQAIVFTDTTGVFNVASMPAAPYDILTVATANSVTNVYRTLLRTSGLPGTHPILLELSTNNLGMWDSAAFRQFGSLTQAPNEKALVYATMATGRTIQAAKNGTEVLTAASPAGNQSIITLIGNSTGGGQPWGTLQEIVLYSTTLTTVQRQQVEGYLAWKWGLQGSLPSSHPFKLFPPSPQ